MRKEVVQTLYRRCSQCDLMSLLFLLELITTLKPGSWILYCNFPQLNRHFFGLSSRHPTNWFQHLLVPIAATIAF